MQRLAEGLGAAALPAVTWLDLGDAHVGDTGASAIAAALGRGALPRLEVLDLCNAAIGDAGLVGLAPALRRLPALEDLLLAHNSLGDVGIAALVAPPLPAGAPPPPTGGLTKLKRLQLDNSQITDAGCATLAFALDSGALPALERLDLYDIPASAAAKVAVREALIRSTVVRGAANIVRRKEQLQAACDAVDAGRLTQAAWDAELRSSADELKVLLASKQADLDHLGPAAQVGTAVMTAVHGGLLRAARAAVRVVGEELCVLGATVIMRRKQQLQAACSCDAVDAELRSSADKLSVLLASVQADLEALPAALA